MTQATLGDSPDRLLQNSRQNPEQIYIGIGGWTFEPWRGVFYPKGLPHAKELAYASERLTSIEVNGTFYRSQTPATFRKWASEVPKGFVFCAQGSALRHQPARAQGSRQLDQAVSRFRRHRTGRPSRPAALAIRADQEIRRRRFRRLSRIVAGQIRRPCRFAMSSKFVMTVFATPEFVALLRALQNAGRVHRSRQISEHRRSHRRLRLCAIATRQRQGRDRLSAARRSTPGRSACNSGPRAKRRMICRSRSRRNRKLAAPVPRDVFAYVIHEGKVRAPAGAMALIARLAK